MDAENTFLCSSSTFIARQSLYSGHNAYPHTTSLSSEGLLHFRRPVPSRRPVMQSSYCAESIHPPPVNNRLYQESRYKTELCRQFEELGECEYGNRCLFAHGMAELRALPNRHPKFKTERCSAYHEYGFCSFGPRCSFIHEKQDPVQVLHEIAKSIPEEMLTRVNNHWETDSCDSIRHMSSDVSSTDFSDSSTDRSESPNSWLMGDTDTDSTFSYLLDTNVESSILDTLILSYNDIIPLMDTTCSTSRTRLPVFEQICPTST